jgi:hypothetical protein
MEVTYWHAVALANAGLLEESLPRFSKVFRRDRGWATLTPRLVPVGILNVDDAALDRILGRRR